MKAIGGIESEVFVIDNNSSDGSMEYLQPRFPAIHFTRNRENQGFGKANNQALSQASGKYVLFLNPDTIVGEDSLTTCISFIESHPQSGATGVRMIDGSGLYLKESKRGLPTPWVSFCKLSGLTFLFPHSKLFAAYYLGHLKENENNQVDVLAGAFMMVKKKVLDITGGFDERFFMYGEDIDLSYRIQQAGYFNYYIAGTTIIHFKGESTRKDLRYVKHFYKAMSQFMRKHFSGGIAAVFVMFMESAIWLRAGMHTVAHLFDREKGKIKNKNIYTFLAGDTGQAGELKTALLSYHRTLVQNKNEANEIIFCEGNNLSFRRVIELFQQEHPSVHYKIHAGKSAGIVGSDSKDAMGESIPL